MTARAKLALLSILAPLACTQEQSDPPVDRPEGVFAFADYTDHARFWATAFPDDGRRDASGELSFSAFGNPTEAALVPKVLALLPTKGGASITAGIFFPLSGPLSKTAELPSPETSLSAASRVFLVETTKGSVGFGRRVPVDVSFREDGGPWGAPNLLALLPYQGTPLRPGAQYAAVVLRSIGGGDGRSLAPSPALWAMTRGVRPAGMSDAAYSAYGAALTSLAALGVPASSIAALSVFETGDPADELRRFRAHMLSLPTPKPKEPWTAKEVFPGYCVFQTTLDLPVYQSGNPPYDPDGGGFEVDPSGTPIVQRTETANVVVTIPRKPMPPSGFPTVVFSRTGGGGDRPLVDRGVRATPGGPAVTPGSGPAREFADEGWAGISVDGPHGGLRNVTKGDEQFLMFNVTNPVALRDNVRQSALELSLTTEVLASMIIDASSCDGAPSSARFDPGMLALMGHSMGATIAPVAAAFEPRFRALLLSGEGGSYIHNVLDKKKPIPPLGVAEVLLRLVGEGYHLHRHDPLLSFFQWSVEAADPPTYGRLLIEAPPPGAAPKHVLMMQGIVDHYILPSIANASTLSFGLDLGGTPLDASAPELASFDPIQSLLPWVGRETRPLPVQGNLKDGAVTAVVTQHLEDGIEDGHEVVFQTEPPKAEYRCFLRTLAQGVPVVTPGACP